MSRATCLVTRDPIDPCVFLRESTSPSDGAAILFVGVVRDQNEGRAVGHLDYEAYPPMAELTLAEIAGEARERWETGRISIAHRYGRLEVGEVSLAIVVAAPHRGDAYAASRYIIEELKKRAPIWKREGYLEGVNEWLRGTPPPPASGAP